MNRLFHALLFWGVVLTTGVLVLSCERAEVPSAIEAPDIHDGVSVVDSYLHFDSVEAVESYLDDVSLGTARRLPSGFVSVRDRSNRIPVETRSAANFEMTAEEYAVHHAEELLVAPALFSIMDTDLLVGVGDRIYKVTDEGTFIFPSRTTRDEIDAYIEAADIAFLSSMEKGDRISLRGGVDFIRTFGSVAGSGDLVSKAPSSSSGNTSPYGLTGNLHSGYNVTTYAWKAGNIWQDILEILLIKDYIRYAELDASHRFAVHVYNNNFGFVEAAGVKAVVQEKRKFLFATYWVNSKEKYEIASGFNYLYSKHKNFMKGGNFSSFAPSAFTGYKMLSSNITGAGNVSFLYVKCGDIPYISGWGKDITFCLPYLSMSGVQVSSSTKTTLTKLYDDPQPSQLMSALRRAASYRGAGSAPAFLMIPYPSSNSQFRNDLALATGARNVTCNGVDIRLLCKGGFSWSGGIPAPIQFSTYDIMAMDTFASVRWNGKWTGIRFVFN